MAKNLPGRLRSDPWVGKIPWSRDWLPTPVFLPGEFHGQKSLASYSLISKSQTQLSDFTFTFMLDLRKGLLRSKADTIQERKGKRGKE